MMFAPYSKGNAYCGICKKQIKSGALIYFYTTESGNLRMACRDCEEQK